MRTLPVVLICVLSAFPACTGAPAGPPLDVATATTLAGTIPADDVTLDLPEGPLLVEGSTDPCNDVRARTDFAAAIALGWLIVECRDGVAHATNTDAGRRLGTWTGNGTQIVVSRYKPRVAIADPAPACDGQPSTVKVTREAVPTQLGRQLVQNGATNDDVGGEPVESSFQVQCVDGAWTRI
jgi:hypothetical protein